MSQSGPATPEYSAPEQITGWAVDGRADQYALACVAFALLAGAPPFVHEDPRAVLSWHASGPAPLLSSRRPGLPPSADQVLARALAKGPQDRYGGCQEFAAALRQALGLAPYGQAAVARAQPPLPAQACPPPQVLVPPPVPAGAAAVTGPSPSSRRSRHHLLAIAAVAGALLITAAIAVPVLVLSGGRKHAPSGSGKPAAAVIHASLAATLTNPEGSNGVNAVAFSPDGTMLAAGDVDDSTYVWDVATGRLAATLSDPGNIGNGAGVGALAFSPDGKMLAAGDGDDNTYLWDLATGRRVATLPDRNGGSQSYVTSVAFSPDGKTLAIAVGVGLAEYTGRDSTYLWRIR
jgi:eukaryotic-like serine/threonine-protein kinase